MIPKSSIAIALLSLILPLAALGTDQNEKTKPSQAVKTEFERLEKVWNDAHLQGDTAALDRLWSDELVVTVPRMQLFDKAQSLAIWRTGRMKFKRYETSDLNIRAFGDTAVVTGALVRERNFMGKEIHEDWRFTKVYIQRDGMWKVVAWHASEAAQ